jgi:hypothetical protein
MEPESDSVRCRAEGEYTGPYVPGCHLADEPRAVLAVILVGVARREVANEPPPTKGGFASRPMVARLVTLGTVR